MLRGLAGVLVFVVLFLVVSCSKSTVATIKPVNGVIHQRFVELAETHLDHPVLLTMPFSGELSAHLQEIRLKPGDTVKQHQLLAQLKQQPLELALEHTQAVLVMASKSILAAQHEVEVAVKDDDHQQKTLQRYRHLLRTHSVSQEKYDQVKLAQQKSRDNLNLMKAKLNVLVAKRNAAKVNTDIMQHRLESSRLYSPIDGTVLSVNHQGGAWVAAGEPIISLGDLKKMNIVCRVLSHRAHQLHEGDQVELGFTRSSFPFTGRITRIYPQGVMERSPLGVKEQRIALIIRPKTKDNMPESIGSRVYVRFTLASHNGLSIPRSALMRNKQGGYFVYVVRNHTLLLQKVAVGIDDDSRVAVLSGLTSSSRLIEFPAQDMVPGQHITNLESVD